LVEYLWVVGDLWRNSAISRELPSPFALAQEDPSWWVTMMEEIEEKLLARKSR
jgi:hypothetical protein